MKLSIENFGAIKKRIVLEPKPLTVFCGANNTGKTYALYVLNAFMDSRFVASFDLAKHHAKPLLQSKSITLTHDDWLGATVLRHAQANLSHSLKESLQRFFVTDGALIEAAEFGIDIDPDEVLAAAPSAESNPGPVADLQISLRHSAASEGVIFCQWQSKAEGLTISLQGDWPTAQRVETGLNRLFMALYFPQRQGGRDFLLPAERSGINLFFRELNSRRAALLRHVTSQTLDTNELLKDIIISRYPQPIHDYIEFMNSQPEIKREQSTFADLAAWLQKEVLKVKYKVDRYGDISIAPLRSGAEIGPHLGSSTVKTFFGLWSYLNHLARQGDWLMIDEPELNLHPRNQRGIARLLAQLVNRGIHVVVSTHSDYMLREWSNLLMLGDDFEGRDGMARQFGLPREQWLSTRQVAAYEFESSAASAMSISAESGIRTTLFDENIQELNDAAQSIYYARQACLPENDSDITARNSTKPSRGNRRERG